jgi:hypothetical protein
LKLIDIMKDTESSLLRALVPAPVPTLAAFAEFAAAVL